MRNVLDLIDALNAGNEGPAFTNDVPSFIAHAPPRLAVANVGHSVAVTPQQILESVL